jgi:DNA-binding NarL/FixJ family response regulator
VDIQMPVLDGIEATRQIVADERLARVRVVILTNFGLDEYIFAALRAGASGFLLKDTQPADLLQALRVVVRGDAMMSPAVTRRLIGEFTARPPDAVAGALVLSPATAKISGWHVSGPPVLPPYR